MTPKPPSVIPYKYSPRGHDSDPITLYVLTQDELDTLLAAQTDYAVEVYLTEKGNEND